MRIIYSDKFLEHGFDWHVERAERLISIKQAISELYEFIAPEKFSEKYILKAHSKRHLELLKELSKNEGQYSMDNPFKKNTFDVAKLAAFAACTAVRFAEERSFALVRPPGHHAGIESFEGFCYLNNIAVATFYALEKYSRVLVLDFDVHLGQGTLEILSKKAPEGSFYFSIHQDPETIYPWNRYEETKNSLLINLQPGVSDSTFISTFEKTFLKVLSAFEPDIIACSAGFDAYYKDARYVGTMLNIKNPSTFKKIGHIIAKAKLPVFCALEGGYSTETLGLLVKSFLEGLECGL